MVKRWFTPQVWQTWISPRVFLKIQHVHGQKMIDPPRYDRPGISPRIFLNIQHMTKDDWPRSHLEFILKIQHVYGEKMIDPPGMTE